MSYPSNDVVKKERSSFFTLPIRGHGMYMDRLWDISAERDCGTGKSVLRNPDVYVFTSTQSYMRNDAAGCLRGNLTCGVSGLYGGEC